MALWKPVNVSQFDRDDIEDLPNEWDDAFKSDLEMRYRKLRGFDETSSEGTDEDNIEMTDKAKDRFKHGTIELIANRIYDRLTHLFNKVKERLGIKEGEPIVEPIANYGSLKLADDGELTYVYKRTVIDLGNINGRLETSWEIRKLGVNKLKIMGFTNITDEDVNLYKQRYKK